MVIFETQMNCYVHLMALKSTLAKYLPFGVIIHGLYVQLSFAIKVYNIYSMLNDTGLPQCDKCKS